MDDVLKQLEKDILHELKVVIEKTLQSLIESVIIKSKDYYVFFNKYALYKKNGRVTVIRKRDDFKHIFHSTKNAVIWILLDNKGKIYESKRMIFLDTALGSIDLEFKIHKKLKNRPGIDNYIIFDNKMQTDLQKKQYFITEIDKYLHMANATYERGNKNELNRTTR